MNITIVCDVLGEANNGTSIASYNLINSLKEKGHHVNVICPDEVRRGEEGYYIVPRMSFGIFNAYVKRNGVCIAKGDMDIIEKACKDADHIHIMLPFSVGKRAMKYALEHHIPVTSGFHVQAENITSHFFAMDIRLANKLTYKHLWKKFYQYMDGIHFPTRFICDYVKKYKMVAKKEFVISNGVSGDFKRKFVEKPFGFKDKFIILMSGRYCKEKNQIMLLKAVARSKYNKDIQVILAGGGPMKKKLFIYGTKYLANSPYMILARRNELIDIINYSDLYVHSSRIEIEAISALEAISCGLVPLINDSKRSATRFFALVPESRFKDQCIKDLTSKIEYWFENRDKIKELSPLYEEFGQRYSYEKCMDEMEKMILSFHETKK